MKLMKLIKNFRKFLIRQSTTPNCAAVRDPVIQQSITGTKTFSYFLSNMTQAVQDTLNGALMEEE